MSMAIRVDDIIVSEKNVLLLSGGHQFVADIERNTDTLDSGDYTRDRNPWNLYTHDGILVNNLFDMSDFVIRTQILTGSSRNSPNNKESHESIFMPNSMRYVGNCQFYNSAYTISEHTSSPLSSIYRAGSNGEIECYEGEYGFIRYNSPSSYENSTEYYIAPDTVFTQNRGAQYITEYPINGFYMDFGDNEDNSSPTVFADSILTKYYFDGNYSVSSYGIDENRSRFNNLRTYYGIGNTGNSIYMVFRNNLNGMSNIVSNDGKHVKIDNISNNEYIGHFSLDTIGYMDNIVTMSSGLSGIYYASTPYSDFHQYSTMSELSSATIVKQPKDKSFILYFIQSNSNCKMVYIPKIGLERSVFERTIEENAEALDILELEHSILVGTKNNGLLTIWSRDYLFSGKDTLVDFNPFQMACSGKPSEESLSAELDGNIYKDFRLFENGKDIVGATAVVSSEVMKPIAFFSSSFSDSTRDYEIGQFFMPAASPDYNLEVITSENYVYSRVLSSVPVSSIGSDGNVNWSYALREIDVVTDTEYVTSDPFQASANYVLDSSVLFDYSSVSVDGNIHVGSYAFVQFEKYGLTKCFVDDIYANDKFVRFTPTGPANKFDSREYTWKHCEFDDVNERIKGNTVEYSELKNLTGIENGFIYGVIGEHANAEKHFLPYDFFEYKKDGNTRTWEKIEKPSKIKSVVDDYEELKTINASADDIYITKTDSASSESESYPSYSFYRYEIDGNVWQWNHCPDTEIINGRATSYDELSALKHSKLNDIYFVSSGYETNTISNSSCGFYTYTLTARDPDNTERGSKLGIWTVYNPSDNGRGYAEQDGVKRFWDSSEEANDFLSNEKSFWAYVTEFNRSEKAYKNKDGKWNVGRIGVEVTFITRKSTASGHTDDYEIYATCTDGGNTYNLYASTMVDRSYYRGFASSVYELMNDIGRGRDVKIDDIYVLSNEDVYAGVTFRRGTFFRKTNDETTTVPGWVTVKPGEYIDIDNHHYVSCFSDFNELCHISVPDDDSVYLVIDAYSRQSETYPPSSFYKFRYEDNQRNWYPYDILYSVNGIIERHEKLKDIERAEEDDIYCVKKPWTRNKFNPLRNHFYTYNIDGNTRYWTISEELGNLKGAMTNYDSLSSSEYILNPDIGDIYYITTSYPNSEDEEEFVPSSVDCKYSFYEYVSGIDEKRSELLKSINTRFWRHLSYEEVNERILGHKSSYSEIENLSGTVGDFYFTEEPSDGLDFYTYGRNTNIKICKGASFSTVSYNDNVKDSMLSVVEFVGTDSSQYFVSGKPALKAVYKSLIDGKYSESFSAFPLEDRDAIKEPIFSNVKSKEIEMNPINTFDFALEKPIEKSMATTVRTYSVDNVNHDAFVSVVKWNESDGTFSPETTSIDYSNDGVSVDGLYLQYNGICTDVYMNGSVLSSVENDGESKKEYYSSTIYEYPHPCYGDFKTAGTGLSIFEGPLSSMTTSDIFFVNDYLVVKNYNVKVIEGKPVDEEDEKNLKFGKTAIYDSGRYPSGGYVVSNFYVNKNETSRIPSLYDSELVFSSKEEAKTTERSETIYDYNYLWHIKPSKSIEFYPESKPNKIWAPYYASKYIDFIKYHNGFYYIALRTNGYDEQSGKITTVGYDIIETTSLFEEKPCIPLSDGRIVSGIRFFDEYVAVEYKKLNSEKTDYEDDCVKWFEVGKSEYKVFPMLYNDETVSSEISSINRAVIIDSEDYSDDVTATYDNIEVMNSLNRFTPIVNHKSNLFSIKIEDLGLDESGYLSDYQKKILKSWFRNKITDIVNYVKPAHTRLFDVYVN